MTQNPTPATKTKPWYKKWWAWLIAAIVVLGVIGSIFDPTPKIQIPDVSGTPAAEAKQQLQELGFRISVKDEDGKTVRNLEDYDAVSTDPLGEASEKSRVTLEVTEATERLAAEQTEKEEAERLEKEEAEAEQARKEEAELARGAELEQSIKNAFGGAEFSELLVEDPTMWVGWINGVRVEGSKAFITLQLTEEGPEDNIGEQTAQALSTLLTKEDVKGISWLIVEDATGKIIGQKQPAPML